MTWDYIRGLLIVVPLFQFEYSSHVYMRLRVWSACLIWVLYYPEGQWAKCTIITFVKITNILEIFKNILLIKLILISLSLSLLMSFNIYCFYILPHHSCITLESTKTGTFLALEFF